MLKKCLLWLLLLFAVGSVSAETYYLNADNFSSTTLVSMPYMDYTYVIINNPGEYILNCSPSYTGFYIAAIFVNSTENVIINGNGNEIPPCKSSYNDYPAVYVKDSTNVTIENLNMGGYVGGGIRYENSNNGKISNCNMEISNYAIYLSNSNYTEVSDNTIKLGSSGINLWNSNYNTIINNNVAISGLAGINLQKSKYNNISNLTIKELTDEALPNKGVVVEALSDNNTFDNINSTVNLHAIRFENSNNNVVKNSVLAAGSTTIEFAQTDISYGPIGSIGNIIYCSNLTADSTVISTSSALSVSNRIYANNIHGAIYDEYSVISFTPTYEMNYSYLGTEYTNYLGNYWYDYNETERAATNVNGIWNVPYNATATINDSYPLAGIVGLDILIGQTPEPESEDEDDGLIHLTQANFTEEDGFIINEPGYYALDENITNAMGITINTSNITIDGCGFYLSGLASGSGISNNGEGELQNITVKNLGMVYWINGVFLEGISDITVLNCTMSSYSNGIYFYNCQNGIISESTFESNSLGIYLDERVENFTITNNQIVDNARGITIYGKNNWIYLNDFGNIFENVDIRSVRSNYFHSPVINYEYDGEIYTGRLGNYYYSRDLGTSVSGIYEKPYWVIAPADD